MLTVTDRALHYYTSSIASERAAFAWPHSSANVRTGGYPPGAYDGLYWRLKDDALLVGLFGWSGKKTVILLCASVAAMREAARLQ